MIRKLALTMTLLSTLLLVNGCGFHLRGATPLPPDLSPLLVQGLDQGAELRTELQRLLMESGIRLTERTDEAAAVLRIGNHRLHRRVLSVDANGKVAEYELHERLNFRLTSSSGEERIADQGVEVTRSYINTEEQVLGKQQEEALLRRDMQRDLLDQLLRRLNAQLH